MKVKYPYSRLIALCCLFLLLCPLRLWSDTPQPIKVFVSVVPLKYLAERVGGSHVDVHVMIAPGQSPATFEPTPRKMAELEGARLFVRIGVPSETAWLPRVIRNNPGLKVIDGRDGIILRVNETGAPRGAGRHHADLDPHVWTSPETAVRIAANIRSALIALDPEHEHDYEVGYQRLKREFSKLDAEIAAQLEPLKSRRFMVFHPAWGYFAAHYHLEQMAIEREGKSPGIRSLGTLVEKAKKTGVKTIIVQPQFPLRDARVIAREIKGRVVVVDPLAYDLPAVLRRMAAAIAGNSPK